MADMSVRWNHLPSVIIIQVYSYLSPKDRLNCSSTCKAWRVCLFHPSLWPRICFKICNSPQSQCDTHTSPSGGGQQVPAPHPLNSGPRFLAKRCGRFVREVVIEVNSLSPCDVAECNEILNILKTNVNIQSCSLRPTSCRLEWLENDCCRNKPLPDDFVEALETIMCYPRKLKHLSLGCIEELLDHAGTFISLLAQHQANSLESLHLASVKEDPDYYPLLELPAEMFDPFCRLQALSLDYDYMSDHLLEVLTKTHKAPLKRLNIHVHGIDVEHPGVSNLSWWKLTKHSPSVQVTITLLHSQDPASVLQDILHPNMPLVHFRSYFSSGLEAGFLDLMAVLNGGTLQSVTLVETLTEDMTPLGSFPSDHENPLVMLAWRCKKLTHLTVMGYEVGDTDLIAIARLRGQQLNELNIPACCITMSNDDDEVLYLDSVSKEMALPLIEEVAGRLGKEWRPLSIEELPPPIANVNLDADGTYLPLLLDDQKWITN